ncbi:hypothetical protein BC830DRAFT_674715 [Chytriomyces sp. MP71]|nr:hypothetical protein BC830DRAFT_674715 [Chytriomyces sp. MP71]
MKRHSSAIPADSRAKAKRAAFLSLPSLPTVRRVALLKAWMRPLPNQEWSEWSVAHRLEHTGHHVQYVDSQSVDCADITLVDANATFFCINHSDSEPMTDASLIGLAFRIQSMFATFTTCTILFSLSNSPHSIDDLDELPYANALPFLAFQRGMDAAYRRLQRDFTVKGKGVIAKADLIPVCACESVLRVLDRYENASIESGFLHNVSTAPFDRNKSGWDRYSESGVEDAGATDASEEQVLTEDASLRILGLLSGRPTPLSRQGEMKYLWLLLTTHLFFHTNAISLPSLAIWIPILCGDCTCI